LLFLFVILVKDHKTWQEIGEQLPKKHHLKKKGMLIKKERKKKDNVLSFPGLILNQRTTCSTSVLMRTTRENHFVSKAFLPPHTSLVIIYWILDSSYFMNFELEFSGPSYNNVMNWTAYQEDDQHFRTWLALSWDRDQLRRRERIRVKIRAILYITHPRDFTRLSSSTDDGDDGDEGTKVSKNSNDMCFSCPFPLTLY